VQTTAEEQDRAEARSDADLDMTEFSILGIQEVRWRLRVWQERGRWQIRLRMLLKATSLVWRVAQKRFHS